MLIIVEGCDGGGKSTLVAALAEAIRVAYPADEVETWHAGPPTSHPLDEYARPLFYYQPGGNHHIICDRWHLGEWVYPRVFGRRTRADDAVWRWLELFMLSRGALVVHVDPRLRTLGRSILERGDDIVRVDQLGAISYGFRDVINRTRLPVHRYRFDQVDPVPPERRRYDVVTNIIAQAHKIEVSVTHLSRFATYIGPPMPQYLLLGDVRHQLRDTVGLFREPTDTLSYGPAFGPYPSTSGHYLLTHLPSEMYDDPGGVGIANACDVDDIFELLYALGHPRTVTLGVRATRRLGAVAHGSAPHPQHIRRFFHQHGAVYGTVITLSALHGSQSVSWKPENSWHDQPKENVS